MNIKFIDKATEICGVGLYEAAVALMDDEIREALHAELAPCGDVEFLAAYMAAHYEKYGKEFEVA